MASPAGWLNKSWVARLGGKLPVRSHRFVALPQTDADAFALGQLIL